jgi:hypothetical protein
MNLIVKSIVSAAFLSLAIGPSMPAFAQNPNPPEVLDLSKVSFQIINVTFMSKLEGGNKKNFLETDLATYRGLVVTLRITKVAGAELTLPCMDINLHYRYGDQHDIANCHVLSNFTTQQYEGRTLNLWPGGWGRVTTGAAATTSSTVYIDVFFEHLEPNTSDLYILIAQPTGSHFTSQGWKQN